MELVIFYNTERYNRNDASKDPITRDSLVKVYDFSPARRYQINTEIFRGTIKENRGLYETSSADFYELHVG